jgi:hypothetical protein
MSYLVESDEPERLEIKKTERGFELIEFTDRNGQQCSLQQSSAAVYEQPGSSAVWFGIGDQKMHLSLEQVKELLPFLQRWTENGSFAT